ncbi:MAG: ectoine hydroxylase-related dioxygenase (phytanoyl-CoA dioxygenase family) [Halieaceae bacterium]|jgi:ectoine hydroxylase-related dioxygenase (phytanoyl-CoA dioxygenase family)
MSPLGNGLEYLRSSYEEHGYVVLRAILDESEISSLARYVERIYAIWTKDNAAELTRHDLVNMHSLTDPQYFQSLPSQRVAFFEAIANAKLTQVVDAIFGSGIYFHNTQLFFNPQRNDFLPYWHRDMQYGPNDEQTQIAALEDMVSLHVRLPLQDERGVELIPGTHARWDTKLEKEVRFERNGHKNSEQLPNSKLIELQAGDVLIFSAQMIHRGNYALNPSRLALDLCIGKPHSLTSEFIDERAQPTAAELEKISNRHWYATAKNHFQGEAKH